MTKINKVVGDIVDDTTPVVISDEEYFIRKNIEALDYGILRILGEIVKCKGEKYTYYV